MLLWPNVSFSLCPPPSDRKLVPLMDCWLSLSLTPALHDRVNSFLSCLSLHNRPSQHPLPDSQPNGGTRPNGFQERSEGGQGLSGAVILPYFRIYFPLSSHFFSHFQVFLKKWKGRRGFTAYWFNLNVTSLNAGIWIIVSYLRAWATCWKLTFLTDSGALDNRIHNKCYRQFDLI